MASKWTNLDSIGSNDPAYPKFARTGEAWLWPGIDRSVVAQWVDHDGTEASESLTTTPRITGTRSG
jgi:hypothetical protein